MTQVRPPKHAKQPEHLSTDKPATTREEKIDRQMEDSFPASDPPSYSGGNHVIGAPADRASPASDSPPPGKDGKTHKDNKVPAPKK